MQANNDTVGLYYTYCVIIRKLFFYKMVNHENDPAYEDYDHPDEEGYSEYLRLKM